jgi:hypothetical protein
MRYFLLLLTALILSFKFTLSQHSPTPVSHVVYLTGNTLGESIPEHLSALRGAIQNEQAPVVLIYNGDILAKEGFANTFSSQDTSLIRSLIDVVKGIPNAEVYFTSGDLDWDNSGENGWKEVRALESLVNGIAGKDIFIPKGGCPGPYVIDLGDDLNMAFISTPWWIHPYDRPHAPATECDVLVEQQFIEQLEGAIEDAEEKNILIIGHHPAISGGNYGGRTSLARHLTPPIVGTFLAEYHQNIGSPKDVAYPEYKTFADAMKYLMQDYSPFIYASAHDQNLQVLDFEDSYQVVSGSISEKSPASKYETTKFRSSEQGFVRLSYYKDGKVMMDAYEITEEKGVAITTIELYQSSCNPDQSGAPVNSRFVPCTEKIAPAEHMNSAFADSIGNTVGGTEYKTGVIGKAFLGSLYRSSWTASIKVPYLNLDTARGGLTATGKGGGRQTHSLSLEGGDGKSYVFRSVNKDPIKAIDPVLRKTFVVGLTRELTATQNPYGAMPVQHLLDATTIFHAQPVLYILPDDPKLGMFQKEYGGMLGMLEEKPKKGKGNKPGSYGADDVVRSFDLFRKLYKDHDNRVDATAFGRARVFDIWIGDWGRHEDNWKWRALRRRIRRLTIPFPGIAIMLFLTGMGCCHFSPRVIGHCRMQKTSTIVSMISRHLPGRHVTSIASCFRPWIKKTGPQLAKELQSIMNDQLIDSATLQFPASVIPLSGNTINKKLKSRREELQPAIMEYYHLLARNVDVVGSNKAEYFRVTRLESGDVAVSMFDKNKSGGPSGDTLYHRIFRLGETKSVNVYGLDGDDVMIEDGAASKTILVRMLGGKGKDVVMNNATGSGSEKRHTHL